LPVDLLHNVGMNIEKNIPLPDAKCENCKRWHDHPDQTFGPRTAFIEIEGSKSEACCHFPISLLKENQ